MLAGEQHIRAGRTFGIRQRAVLLHDELAPQRDHEEHAEPSADEREKEDARVLKIEAEKDQRRQGEDDAGRNRLAGIARGLDDVVFKDRSAAKRAQHADGKHRDRNRRRDRQTGAQSDVDGNCAEKNPEERTQQKRAEGQLRPRLGGWNKRLKLLRGLGLLCGLGHGCDPPSVTLIACGEQRV